MSTLIAILDRFAVQRIEGFMFAIYADRLRTTCARLRDDLSPEALALDDDARRKRLSALSLYPAGCQAARAGDIELTEIILAKILASPSEFYSKRRLSNIVAYAACSPVETMRRWWFKRGFCMAVILGLMDWFALHCINVKCRLGQWSCTDYKKCPGKQSHVIPIISAMTRWLPFNEYLRCCRDWDIDTYCDHERDPDMLYGFIKAMVMHALTTNIDHELKIKFAMKYLPRAHHPEMIFEDIGTLVAKKRCTARLDAFVREYRALNPSK